MRILHIVGTMDPAAGGPTEVIRMLVTHAPAGFTSEIATTDPADAPWLRALPVPAHGLGQPTKSWYAPRLLPWLRANRERFDGVIVHGLWEYTGLAARRAFRGNIPYVVFPHGMLDPYFKKNFPAKHLKKLPYWLLIEYWNLRHAFRVLFTTALERDLATQSFALHHWNPVVVPLGTEPPPDTTDRLAKVFHKAVPTVQNRRFLLYLGRIHPKKGADLLLDTFTGQNAIAALDPELDLVMAGPGLDDAWGLTLQKQAEASGFGHRIHWPGMLTGHAKWGAFAACEAFVLPSHQENFGIAVVEALASSRPALLTHPVNIAPEVVADGSGLAAADTRDGVYSMLQAWLAVSPEDRQRMSGNALQTFKQRFNMQRNTEAILRVFELP